MAFLAYLVVSLVIYGVPVLSRFASAFVGEGHGDAKLYVWALGWWPHAISAGLNPFLPKVLFAPQGMNMAWVTGLPGPALALWPVTALFGPVVSSNLLAVLAPALSGWTAFLLCRKAAAGRFWPALAAGYLFGFSTYMTAEMHGHLNLFLVFPVPLAVYLVVRWFEGSLSGLRFAVLLGLTLVAEFSISTEVFASMAFFGVAALAGLLLFVPSMRRRAMVGALWIGGAYVVAAAILSPYLYYVVKGAPTSPLRPAVAAGGSSEDLLSYLVPRPSTLIGGATFRRTTKSFLPNLSEDGAYLSPALLVALAWAAWACRRDRVVVLSLLFGLFAALMALGTRLHVDGSPSLPLPWTAFARVPLLQDALPQRFTMYAWLAFAVVVARWVGSGPRIPWRWAPVGAAAVLLLPNIFLPNIHGTAEAPSFFADGLYRQYLQANETVLILHPGKGQEMLWQADANFWFAMAQGRAGSEPPAFRTDASWLAIRSGNPGYMVPSAFRTFLLDHNVQAVIVDDSVLGRWRYTLTKGLRVAPVSVEGVEIYRPPSGQSSF